MEMPEVRGLVHLSQARTGVVCTASQGALVSCSCSANQECQERVPAPVQALRCVAGAAVAQGPRERTPRALLCEGCSDAAGGHVGGCPGAESPQGSRFVTLAQPLASPHCQHCSWEEGFWPCG